MSTNLATNIKTVLGWILLVTGIACCGIAILIVVLTLVLTKLIPK